MEAVIFMSDHCCRKTYRGKNSIPRALKLVKMTGSLCDDFFLFYFSCQFWMMLMLSLSYPPLTVFNSRKTGGNRTILANKLGN
jgi:hypothetical protein